MVYGKRECPFVAPEDGKMFYADNRQKRVCLRSEEQFPLAQQEPVEMPEDRPVNMDYQAYTTDQQSQETVIEQHHADHQHINTYNNTRPTATACSRCQAGESGHFGHIGR